MSTRYVAHLAGAFALVCASTAFAQTTMPAPSSNGPVTRASEKADLKKLEANGYKPEAQDANYPNDIQKAEKSAYGSGAAPTKPSN